MSEKRRVKRYNPHKHAKNNVSLAELTPIYHTLDHLSDILKKRLGNCDTQGFSYLYYHHGVRAVEGNSIMPEIYLLAFLYQHTFVVDKICEIENHNILDLVVSLRNELMSLLEDVELEYPNELNYEDVLILSNKLVEMITNFIDKSKLLFINLRRSTYIKAYQQGSSTCMLALRLKPEHVLAEMIDVEAGLATLKSVTFA